MATAQKDANAFDDASHHKSGHDPFGRLEYMVIDAFTDRPFAGNPAAVLQLPCWPEDTAWLQLVANEFNLSETAFLVKRDVKSGGAVAASVSQDSASTPASEKESADFDLRWFTPTVEVDLCGHATLASAHFLWASRTSQASLIRFHTASGVLTARRVNSDSPSPSSSGDLQVGPIELDFPTVAPEPCPDLQDKVADALETSAIIAVMRSRFDVLVELTDVDSVRRITPDFRSLAAVSGRGVIVTAAAGTAPIDGRQVDFVSRFFAPASGIDEDPVTGSAHCTLGPYWAEKMGKVELLAYQASRRGGHLKVIVDSDARRVRLQGTAFVTTSGILRDANLAFQTLK
ncbi:hypothetical protein KFL_010210040 [Klebsormidium nitens]|uniref:Phenazine biosynthesis PhzC/PhzF family protein n=1 Tax=Klebsormidium nitens TaxID=105231 RepID=A0A1Y1INM5_KLENI|nr:hypothetical protein KFL_010210040 [Klebsormidium nitens]|eukprot:GAQ92470.1 hypothetical protein KFL_010210040 [Klebsormidium nitens]